jgi:hypothetical protein
LTDETLLEETAETLVVFFNTVNKISDCTYCGTILVMFIKTMRMSLTELGHNVASKVRQHEADK